MNFDCNRIVWWRFLNRCSIISPGNTIIVLKILPSLCVKVHCYYLLLHNSKEISSVNVLCTCAFCNYDTIIFGKCIVSVYTLTLQCASSRWANIKVCQWKCSLDVGYFNSSVTDIVWNLTKQQEIECEKKWQLVLSSRTGKLHTREGEDVN